MLKFSIPENIDWEQVFIQHPHKFNDKKCMDELTYICGQITYLVALYREDIYKDDTEFIPLCSKYLKPIAHNYSRYMNYLVEAGVLVSDNHFINGEECRGYQFAELYRGTGLKKVEIQDFILRGNIKKQHAMKEMKSRVNLRGYSHLTKWFDTGKLECNLPAALKWIKEYEEAVYSYFMSTICYGDAYYDEPVKRRIKEKADGFRMMLDFFTEEDYHMSVDDAGYRFYSILTNLKKELRCFITYSGMPLVSLDIKNSQPYILLMTLQELFWRSEGRGLTLKKVRPELYEKLRTNATSYQHIITLLKTSKSLYQPDLSTAYFKEYVCSGQLYEHISREFSGKYIIDGDDRFNTREKAKKEVMRFLYFDTRRIEVPFYSPYKQFKGMFPTVGRVVDFLKSESLEERQIKESNAYKNLPILLQNIECELVLKVIARYIAKEKTDMPLFSIHDSLITTVGNEDYLEAVMNKQLTFHVSYPPTFAFESWNPDAAFLKLADKGFLEDEAVKLLKNLDRKKNKPEQSEFNMTKKSWNTENE